MKKYEATLRHDNFIVLGHKINQIGVLPGVALIDFIYRALNGVVPIKNTSLINCLFHEAITFEQSSEKKIRLIVDDELTPNKITIYSQDVNQTEKWVLNFESEFIHFAKPNGQTFDIEALKKSSQHVNSFNSIYNGLRAVGIVHDDFMQVEGEIYQSDQFILLELALSTKASRYVDKFSLHPAMLDAATIGSILPIYQEITDSKHAYIPLSIERFNYVNSLPRRCYVLMNIQDVFYFEDFMQASFSIHDPNGDLITEVKNLVNKRIRKTLDSAGKPRWKVETHLESNGEQAPFAIKEKLINLLKDYLNEPIDINDTENFYHLGLDSQALISIVHKLEKITGAQLYPTLLFEYNNLNKLSQYLSQYFPTFDSHISSVSSSKDNALKTNQSINFLTPTWVELPWPNRRDNDFLNGKIQELLIFSEDTAQISRFRNSPAIVQSRVRVIQVIQANDYCMVDENTYQVNQQNEYHVKRLLEHLWAQGVVLRNIIDCRMFLNPNLSPSQHRRSEANAGTIPIFEVALLLKNLQLLQVRSIRYLHCYLYDDYSVNSGYILTPYFKSLKLEDPSFNYQVIGWQGYISEDYLENLYLRFFDTFETANFLLRDKTCYELQYTEIRNTSSQTNNGLGKDNGTYVITGGAGKIGLSIARQLVGQLNAKVYLLGRSKTFPQRLTDSKIKYIACDVANRAELLSIIPELKLQSIDAVFHCAGVLKDVLHINTQLDEFEKILKPKWQGTLNLYELCTNLNIPHLFLFSSLTSVMGNIGQTQYATANAFLDEFSRVAYTKRRHNKAMPSVLSVNWPLWDEGGMVSAESKQMLLEKWALEPLTTSSALHCLKASMDSDYPQVVISNDIIKSYLKVKATEHNELSNNPFDIAIIGLSGRYPMAKDVDIFWENLCAARDCITHYPTDRFTSSPYPYGGFLDNADKFDPQFFGISPKDAKVMDPQERLFLQTAWHAFEDAGYGKLQRNQYESIGVFVGAMFSLYQLHQNKSSSQLANSSFASIANRVSYCLDLNGPSLTLDTMCSSSLTALHYACESIKSGESQLALVGGVNIISHQSKYDELLYRGFLSKDGRCKVFSVAADGYVPGEGVGAILIKRLDRAIKDNDHIYGIIKGSGINHSGKGDGYTVPSIEHQSKLIKNVLDKTNVHPDSIHYFEAHGTGTALGDPIELQAIANAYKAYHDKKQYCAIGSVKSNIGHLESAAGIAGLTKILLQFKHEKLVPTLHASPINPGINFNESPCFIQDRLCEWESTGLPRRAAISGFGAGGTNVHCILEEYHAEQHKHVGYLSTHLFLFSAKTELALARVIHAFHQWLEHRESNIDLQSLSLTLALGRDHFHYRIAIIAGSVTDLRAQLSCQVKPRYKQPQKCLASISTDEDDLVSLAYYYQQGEHIDWPMIYAKRTWHKMSLPTYPFEEEAYWFFPNNDPKPLKMANQIALNFYEYKWKQIDQNLVTRPYFKPTQAVKLIMIDIDNTRYETLKANGFTDHIVLITQGDEVKQLSSNHYEFNFKNQERCEHVFRKLFSSAYNQAVILYFLSDKSFHEDNIDSFESEFENSFLNLHFLCQSLFNSSLTIPVNIHYFYRVNTPRPVCAAVSAYFKTIMRENTKVSGRGIKINNQDYSADYFVDIVRMELAEESFKAIDVAYSSGARYCKEFDVVNELSSARPSKHYLEQHGVYLIVGGLGKLGLLFANYLASLQTVHLILIGRKSVDDQFIKQHLNLEKTDSTAVYYACDVAQYNEVEALISKIKTTHSKINGIINSSSTLNFSPVYNKTVGEISSTLSTKCLGTNNLDLATSDEKLDWFVCFSSLAAVIGFPEGCDYAFGNAYLDEFVIQRNRLVQDGKRFGRTISFNWPVWQDGGMIKKNAETQQSWEKWMIKSQGVVPMSRESGLAAFDRVMHSHFSQMIIAEGYDDLIQKTLRTGFHLTAKDIQPTIPIMTSEPLVMSSTEVQTIIQDTVSELLELPKNKIDLHTAFSEFGFESMSLISLSERLSQRLKIEVLPSLFFSENTIHKLAGHLNDYYEPSNIQGSMKKTVASGLEYAFTEKNQPLKIKQNVIEQPADINDIAIVGMDGKFPNSDDLDAFWQNLVEGIDLVSEIPENRWNWQAYYQQQPGSQHSHSKWGGFLSDIQSFDADFFKISDAEAQMMDPQHRLFLEVAWRAIENAGQSPEALAGKPIGVFVGVQFNDYQNTLFENKQTNFYIATGNSHALIANRLSYMLDLCGPSESIDTACSSALVAINRAVNAIKLGECESAIVGATTCILNPMSYVVTSQLGIISPEGQCKVFDAAANGYVKGEGVGALWLMPLKLAKERNYPIHGLIKGIGVNHGGKSSSLTAPNVKAQQQLLVDTYKKSNIAMDSISFLETHGTGTLLGDSVEVESIKAANQELVALTATTMKPTDCYLGAVKSNAGHLEPAAGIIGVIKVLLMLKHSFKVKNLHLNALSPYIKLDNTRFKIQKESEPWPIQEGEGGEVIPRRAGVSSFGFGGTNAHIILEEYVQSDKPVQRNKPYYLCALSAKTDTALFKRISELEQFLNNHPEESIEDISYTLNVGRSHYKNRCAIVAEDLPALQRALSSISTNIREKNVHFSSETNTETITPLHHEMLGYLQNELMKTQFEPDLYFNKLQSLAILYTLKLDLNWDLLHADESKKRGSLPSYPFDKINYWVMPEADFNNTFDKQGHLLGKNLSTANLFHFELNIDANNVYFSDHVVNHQQLLPGVIILEIIYEAVKFLFPQQSLIEIKKVHWLQPINALVLQAKLSILFKPAAQGYYFELVQSQEISKVFTKGEIQFSNAKPPLETIDLATIRKNFVDEYSRDDIYKQFTDSGIHYGASFQAITKAYRWRNEVFSEIKLSKKAIGTLTRWSFHPCLIDAALQSSVLFFEQFNTVGYLYALEKVCLLQELSMQASYFAHLQKNESGSISLKLYDEVGKLCLVIATIIVKSQTKSHSPLSCLKTYWVKSSLPAPVQQNSEEDKILIISTKNAQERAISESLMVLSPIGQTTCISWDKMTEVFKSEKELRYKTIYILFNQSIGLNELAIEMSRCAYDLLLFLQLLAKQNTVYNTHLKFITINAFYGPNTTIASPISAALTGLIHSFQQEKLQIKVSCIDVEIRLETPFGIGEILRNEPAHPQSAIVAIDERANRFVRTFSLHDFPAIELMSYRKNGVYLIVGGANGVGFEFGKFLAKNYKARLIFVGRTAAVEQAHKIKIITELGGSARYFQADIGNADKIADILDKVQKDYDSIHGVIHSALVLDDKPIDKIDLPSMERVLKPKVQGTIHLLSLLKDRPLDFLLIFSSAQSYLNNAGQSSYAVASIFQDQLAKQFRSEVNFPIKVVNWGYWGKVGAVATEYYQQQMQRKGVFSIDVNEGFKLLEQFLISSLDDCILLSAKPSVIEALTQKTVVVDDNEGFLALEQFTAQLIFSAFQKSGYFNETGLSYQVSELLESMSVRPMYHLLFKSILTILSQEQLINYDEQLGLINIPESTINMEMGALKQHLGNQYPALRPHIELVCQCSASLLQVLNGQMRHTEVLFPDNQYKLVEDVYTSHPISKSITSQLVSYVISAVEKYCRNYASTSFNLLEIGAGTGSASAEILQALIENKLKVNYFFTDLSEGFLQKAKFNPRLSVEGVQFRRLDICQDLFRQGFEANTIDLVLANNVLHATGNIAKSLEQVNLLLKDNGIILINELTQSSYFLTATFGLTPEWWRHDPKEQTIPDSPLLNLENWKSVLAREHYRSIETPRASGTNREALSETQQIIIATKIAKTAGLSPVSESIMTELDHYLKTMFSEILKLPASDIQNHVSLGEYGLDSLVTLEATERLKKIFHPFSNTILFEHSTIDKLMHYLLENYSQAVHHLVFGKHDSNEAPVALDNCFTGHPKMNEQEANLVAPQLELDREDDIAIIGFNGRFPGAETTQEFWDLLLNKKVAITDIPIDRPFHSPKAYLGGFLKNVEEFDAHAFNISPREALKMDPQERIFLESCWELLEHAGYTKAQLSSGDISVGSFVGAMNTDYSLYSSIEREGVHHNYSALWSIANRVSYFFNLTGPSLTIDTACASSLTAIHMACQSIRHGECQLAIAGGVNLILHPNHYTMLDETNMLSKKNYCVPFSDDSDGMIIGEGVGVLLLKPLSCAIRDKDIIHAVIKGSHVNSGGKTKGYMVPNPSIQETLMRQALKRAKVDASTISYIETQGTGTKLGDEIEIEALQRVYGNSISNIGTLKPNIGHLESAAGVIGVIKIVLQMKHKLILPAIGGDSTNQAPLLKSTSFKLPERLMIWPSHERHSRRAAISAFGAGGSNAHLIIEESYAPDRVNNHEQPYYLFLVSAKNADALTLGFRKLYLYLEEQPSLSLQDIAYTLAVRREHFNYRGAIIASSMQELLDSLKAISEEKEGENFWRSEGKVNLNHSINLLDVKKMMANINNTAGYLTKLTELAEKYIQGEEINWSGVFQHQDCCLVELPTYSFIRQRYWSGELSKSQTPLDLAVNHEESPLLLAEDNGQVQNYLLACISSILKIPNDILDTTENLLEYGFDSITLSHLIAAIESRYHIPISPVVVMEYPTVASLSSYLESQIQLQSDSICESAPCAE